ncbi:phage integrase SAM-like domain-containing protein [Pontibacter silvestris]|uniref:Phage integrase SAM-like domain-containing protein n=1 Tax=Pontibacter silvestris TaxID=2305183 RepID=A0ABW4X1K1_9BACT|nr:phage integrase SAM-like domain-containing protein [Pontibacter silvestris]MCC9137507.1 phage integrase SAM-like domain-containing protein [Pontibacter silvestris]
MSVNFSLLFYLKKQKNYRMGSVPIYLRITVAGKRAELATGRECEPERWNASAGRAAGTKASSKSLNAYLDSLQVKVYEAHRQLVEASGLVTATAIKNRITGKEEKGIMLLEVFQDHNRRMEALVGDEFAPGTLERYTTSLKHTADFLWWKFQVPDIDIRKIDHAFITEYEFYLRSIRGASASAPTTQLSSTSRTSARSSAFAWQMASFLPIPL